MNRLSFFIFFTTFVCSYQSEFFLKESNIYLKNTKQFIDVCLKETGLSKEMFDEFEHIGEVLGDKKFLCFMYCMGLKPGYFTTNNTINFDVVAAEMEVTDKEIINEMKGKCKFSTDEDKCSAARDAILCVIGTLGLHQN